MTHGGHAGSASPHGRMEDGKTLRDMAGELNRLAIRTPRGSEWYASTVRKQLAAPATAASAAHDPAQETEAAA